MLYSGTKCERGAVFILNNTKSLCRSALIAALYTVLTFLFQSVSFGPVQFRIAEALTLLPVLYPEAVGGLAVGCLLSALLNPLGASVYDAVFGTLATFVAALLTRQFRSKPVLSAIAPILCNGITVGLVLTYAYHTGELLPNMGLVAAGEAAVIFLLGFPLLKVLQKYTKGKGADS